VSRVARQKVPSAINAVTVTTTMSMVSWPDVGRGEFAR
jgi:hypothetical protein